jgi:hypothetical protein
VTPPLLVRLDPPLHPSGDEGRAALRRELLKSEYHDRNWLEQVVNWFQRQLDSGLDKASHAPPLSTLAAMVVFVLLALALGWLASRARRTARTREASRAVLTDEVVSAAELRARAEAALAEGRCAEAVVEGFRALTVRQVERGRLRDAPGATAHEVSQRLATEHPAYAAGVGAAATLFDAVLYGDRPATPEQATSVLALDDELAGARR